MNSGINNVFTFWEVLMLAGVILVFFVGYFLVYYSRQKKNKHINKSIHELKRQIEDADNALNATNILKELSDKNN